jgi:hypothetical protein
MTKTVGIQWGVLLGAAAAASVACGSAGSSDGFAGTTALAPEPGGVPVSGSSSGGSGGADSAGSADAGTVPALPPEKKSEGAFQTPVSTGSIVWIANPTSGRVAYIDASTFTVQTVAAGNGPTYLAAVPDPSTHDDVAIVANTLSHDATLLRVHQGALTTQTYPSTADANGWAVSSSGHWAIAWTDATRVTSPDPAQGFQDVAVLDLTGAHPATILSVGYRPSEIAFAADESHAFAVTQDGISGIDLTGAQPVLGSNVPLPAPAAAPAPTPDAGAAQAGSSSQPDVSITSDGAYALVRVDGVQAITIVSLADGSTTSVPLPSAATDLTLAPNGQFAVAVLRSASTVALLPLPGILTNPALVELVPVPGETIGRAVVTQGGARVLLFTTAAPIDRLTVLDLQPAPAARTIQLRDPVLAVFPTDDELDAVVLHSVTPVAGSTVKGAFSLVPIASDLPPKIVSLPAAPTAVALSPSSDRALVALRDDASLTYGLQLAKLPTFEVTPYTLASPPTAVGIAAGAGHGYVAQDYAEGRITFVDLAAGAARTITGFELGARIVEGSQP